MELQIVYAYIYVTCMRTRGCSIKERRGKYLSRVPGYPRELEVFIACIRKRNTCIHVTRVTLDLSIPRETHGL